MSETMLGLDSFETEVDLVGTETNSLCPHCNDANLRVGNIEYSSVLLVCPSCGFEVSKTSPEVKKCRNLKS